MIDMPREYEGREQTWLKHRVLKEYLLLWALKLGSRFRDLWYVDCFAGPWASQDEDRSDTSVAIGLGALTEAAATWSSLGRSIALHAVFVEKDPRAFAALKEFAQARSTGVDLHVLFGEFGSQVEQIDALIGRNPAFVFIDPKGWKGADLKFIARIARRERRDVLVNVMYDHINRFKDDPRVFLRDQMKSFFGLADSDLESGLTEEGLMEVYRQQVKEHARVPMVADLAVPVPTRDRTYFRLVVAGHHPKVVELFRDVEAKVIGREAATVRRAARDRSREERTGQPLLLAPPDPAWDEGYADLHAWALREIRRLLPVRLQRSGPQRFDSLWPNILCAYHLTLAELRDLVWTMRDEGVMEIRGLKRRERTVHDGHFLALPGSKASGA